MFETDYCGCVITDSHIATEACQKWQRGEGSGIPAVDWEMTRRCLGLVPHPTEEEIREEAFLVYCERISGSLPGTAQEDWHEAQNRLRRRFRQEWESFHRSRLIRPRNARLKK